jgi:hypothetical protein
VLPLQQRLQQMLLLLPPLQRPTFSHSCPQPASLQQMEMQFV